MPMDHDVALENPKPRWTAHANTETGGIRLKDNVSGAEYTIDIHHKLEVTEAALVRLAQEIEKAANKE